jgi:uncharacterized protein YndB with AHSA1/START domain
MGNESNSITVKIKIDKPIASVWQFWTNPADIANWNIPFENWHCPKVENDLKVGGKFCYRMESKDGNEGFDHDGIYDKVVENQLIEYTVSDGRKSIIEFISDGENTQITETFEPEKDNPIELQKEFCSSVLQKFKIYTESKN